MLLLSWRHFLQHVPSKLCRGGVQSWWYRTGFCFSLKTGRTRLRTILTGSLQGSLSLWSILYVSLKWSGELLKDCKVQVCRWPLGSVAAAGPTVICVVMLADVGTQSITVSLLRPFLLWGRCPWVVISRQKTFPTASTPASPHITRPGTYSETT